MALQSPRKWAVRSTTSDMVTNIWFSLGDNWNSFGCDVSETLLQQTANLIVDYGLKDLGYYYVILDDCWSAGRNGSDNNTLLPDLEKFPNGMKRVADDIHDLGLGFGMYSSAGSYTCGRFAGSLGYEEVDANTWASKFSTSVVRLHLGFSLDCIFHWRHNF